MTDLLRLREEAEDVRRRTEEALEAYRKAVEDVADRMAVVAREAEYARRQMTVEVQLPAIRALRELVKRRMDVSAQIAEVVEQQRTVAALTALADQALRDVSFRAMRDLAVRLSRQPLLDETIHERSVGAIDLAAEVATPEEVYDVPEGDGAGVLLWLVPSSEAQLVARVTIIMSVIWFLTGLTPTDIRNWMLRQGQSQRPGTMDESTVELREAKRNAPIREDGNRTANETGRVYAGQIVSVLDGAGRWCRMRTLDLQEGWVFKGHLKEMK